MYIYGLDGKSSGLATEDLIEESLIEVAIQKEKLRSKKNR